MGIISSSSNCPPRPDSGPGQPIAGSLTFKHLISIICWVCFGVSTLLWLSLVIPHLRRYAAPNEQRQIIRIVLTPLVFAIFAVISTHAYHAADYLEPLSNLYEAFALASLFLLYVQYVAPDEAIREQFFQNLEVASKRGNVTDGLRWFRVRTTTFSASSADKSLRGHGELFFSTSSSTQYSSSSRKSPLPRAHTVAPLPNRDMVIFGYEMTTSGPSPVLTVNSDSSPRAHCHDLRYSGCDQISASTQGAYDWEEGASETGGVQAFRAGDDSSECT
jgi:hypothetical protein